MHDPADTQRLLSLHRRLLDGDRVASEECAELLLEQLVGEVARKFPHTDIHLVSDGVTDALLDYWGKPFSFDLSRGVPLYRFLVQASKRNVSNLLRGEQRRKVREEKWAESLDEKVVELCVPPGNPMQNEVPLQRQQLAKLAQAVEDPVDKKVFELRMKGERRTTEFAKVLGLTHLTVAEQRRQVKQAKDRIEKALQRRKGPRL